MSEEEKDLLLSLEIVMTKENIEELHSNFYLVEDKERWPVCETMWCCKKCSKEKGTHSPCRCSEIEAVTTEGDDVKIVWMPTRISCDGCGLVWKPSKTKVSRK
jgi:hypothetical protein